VGSPHGDFSWQFIVQLSRRIVGRGLAPAAEKWNIFRVFRSKTIELCLRHGILLHKMPGGRQPAPYDKTIRQTEICIFSEKNKNIGAISEIIFAFCGFACYTIWAL
jgi:hypothetical protein